MRVAKPLLGLLLLAPVLCVAAPTKVVLDHDGGIDDFVTLLLLLSRPAEYQLLGINILDADCIADVAANTTIKMLHTLNITNVPVAISTLQGVNPFPDVWRWSGLAVDVQPVLNNFPPGYLDNKLIAQPGEDFLAQLLLNADEPVVVVATGPLSAVAHALQQHGEAVATKIKEIWWMGGALQVPGNVHKPGHDGSAEWNAYWDPLALGPVWASRVPLVVVPLDATNQVPVTPELLYRFGPQANYPYSMLAGMVWSSVINWVYETPDVPYYAWDALTAACLLQPGLCVREDDVSTYAVLSGPSQGRTVEVGGGSDSACDGGTCPNDGAPAGEDASVIRRVSVIRHVDAEAFYSYILDALKM